MLVASCNRLYEDDDYSFIDQIAEKSETDGPIIASIFLGDNV
jgi:hypothetical protein